jgi:hypothetical protein
MKAYGRMNVEMSPRVDEADFVDVSEVHAAFISMIKVRSMTPEQHSDGHC